jgi:predicted ATPase
VLFQNPNLIVISGGPGAGKTTLLNELAARRFVCASEVAREIIQEQMRIDGPALPWRDRQAYTRLMLEGSVNSYLEHAASQALVFFDRGIPDSLCYARLIALPDQTSLLQACTRYRYAATVFLCPPWPEIYHTDAERKQDFAEARQTFALLAEVYRECGYDLAEIPKTTPAKRAQFVLRHSAVRAR